MITELELTNFRGIKKGSLKLSNLTILIGSNNSGKTTIIESLYLLPNPFRLTPYVIQNDQARAIEVIHAIHKTLESEGYSFLLNNYTAENAEIRVQEDNQEKLLRFLVYNNGRTIGLESPAIGGGMNFQYKNENRKGFGSIQRGTNHLNSNNDTSLITKNALLISQNLIKSGIKYIQQNWASIMNQGIGTKVAQEASIFSNDEYLDITLEPFLENLSSINAYFKNGKRIRLGDLGEGIQNYLIAKMLYEIEQPNLILWDDLEAHLNPRMILNISNWFASLIEQNKQIVVTTHSLETVKMISGIVDETSIILTSVEEGILKTKSMDFDEFDNITKTGIDPRVSERFLL